MLRKIVRDQDREALEDELDDLKIRLALLRESSPRGAIEIRALEDRVARVERALATDFAT